MRQPREARHLRADDRVRGRGDRVPSSRWLGLYAVLGGLLLACGVSVTGAGAFFELPDAAAPTTTTTTTTSTTTSTTTTVPPEEAADAIEAVEGGPDDAPADP